MQHVLAINCSDYLPRNSSKIYRIFAVFAVSEMLCETVAENPRKKQFLLLFFSFFLGNCHCVDLLLRARRNVLSVRLYGFYPCVAALKQKSSRLPWEVATPAQSSAAPTGDGPLKAELF